ncbi:glutaminyl-peptide cyclotransferase [Rhodococcoides trifolii]|uniref:Glutaminyl-peptide cyclotransferase n=2 Tax=Rhodococcoides trifolii TaxID=908250 RepID=A0A917LGV9_9NOCA|nr:glutaminyl-peptide cyclotransferase [Rhodococcus trifolii]
MTLVVLACVSACSSAESTPPADVPGFDVRIERTFPHDPTAFTQGFEIDDGRLIEGTGRSGQSRITATDLASGEVVARADLPVPLFGEGITRTRDGATVWQLTWQNGIAIARDPDTLAEKARVQYAGEGWGICALADGRLVTSDGSSTLTLRDPSSFDVTGTVAVTRSGEPRDRLNELECTPDGVLANVWQTNDIVRIDTTSGLVTADIDASPLRSALGSDADGVDVLNGIAAVPGTDRFLMTGKLWPTTFEVSLVPRNS